jgi:BlaI family transcriptional regulator, penicillinase repressor
MKLPRLGRLELRVMEIFWELGPASVREIHEAFPPKKRPAYTTIQTTAYRLEEKKALRLVKRVGKAKVFESTLSRAQVQASLIDQVLHAFGGEVKPVIARLVEAGKFTMEDVKEAEQMVRERREKEKWR